MTQPRQPPGSVSITAARGAVIRGVAEIAGKVATLAWTVAAARLLSESDFGVVAYGLAIMLLVSAVPAWGFDTGLVRRGSAEPDLLERLHGSVQWWKTLLSVPIVTLTALVVLPGQDDAAARWTVAVMLLAVLPELWSMGDRAAASARHRAAGVSMALVVQRLVTGVLIVAALLAGWGKVGVAVAFLAGTVIGWLAHVVVLRRMALSPRLRRPERADLRLAARGTWLLGVNGLLLMLLMRVDALLLEGLQGVEAVAVYAMAYRLLETVLFVTYAINQAVFPVLSASTDPTRWRRGYERSLSAGAFVYLPFLAVVAIEGQALASLLYGDRLGRPVAEILMWLGPAPLAFAAAFFGSILLMAMQSSRSVVWATSVAAVVNVVLNLVLIPLWSGVGAAVATTVGYTVLALCIQVALRSQGIRPRLLRPLLPSTVAAWVLAGVLAVLPLPLVVELSIGGLAFVGSWLLVAGAVDPVQRDVVVGLLRRRSPATTSD